MKNGEVKLLFPIVLLLACVVAHAIGISHWLARDRAQPAGEIARYLIQTDRVSKVLAHPTADIARKIVYAHPEPQPPLLAAAGSMFHLAAPENPDAPVLAQTIFVALAAAGAFVLGWTLRSPATGALSAILLTSSAFVAIHEHRMLPDLPMLAFAACACAAFVASDGFRRRVASASLGILIGLGLLTHWNFSFACAGIAVGAILTLFYAILRITAGGDDAKEAMGRGANVLLMIAAASATAGPWLIERGAEAWRYAAGGAPALRPEEFLYYLKALPVEGSLALAVFIILAFLLFIVGILTKRGNARPVDVVNAGRAGNCILSFAGAYVALSLAPSKDLRYAGLLLPPACGFVAYALAGLRFNIIRIPVVSAAVAFSILTYLAVGFDILASDDPRARPSQTLTIGNMDFRAYQPADAPAEWRPAPGHTILALASLKNPPDTRDPNPWRALDAIDRDVTENNARVFIVTPQELLHGSALEYWCEANYPKLTPLLLREYYAGDPRNLEFAAFSPYEFLVSHYLIIARRRGGPNAGEKANFPFGQAFTQYLLGEAPKFRAHFIRIYAYEPTNNPYDRANDLIVEVYRRNAPADLAEVQEIQTAISRFDRVKPGTWVDIAYFWLHSGRREDAKKIVETNVKDPAVLAPVHRDRLAQILRETAK